MQDVPSGAGGGAATVMARDMAAQRWGQAVAAEIPPAPPPGAGSPRKVIVFDYVNERRGGEVIAGGTVAYWDGENVVPLVTINLGTTVPGAPATSRPEIAPAPFRPLTDAHIAVARALQDRPVACEVSDRHAQARLLAARDSSAATV